MTSSAPVSHRPAPTAAAVTAPFFREGMPGYVLRDWEVIDYCCYELAGTGLWFRGPEPPSLRAGDYFTAIGAAQTFGCFCLKPYPALLEERLGRRALNLGYSGAGPKFFLRNPALIDYINRSAFCIIQVMSGRSTSNALFDSPVGLAHGRRRADGTPIMGQQIFAEQIAHELTRVPLPRKLVRSLVRFSGTRLPAVERLVRETKDNWLTEYRALLASITVPKIFFWFSERTPTFRPSFHSAPALLGRFPHLVDQNMIDTLRPLVDHYVECVSTRGRPQRLFSRFTGEQVTVDCTWDRKVPADGDGEGIALYSGVWKTNRYYPTPEMQEDGCKALEEVGHYIFGLTK